MLAIFEAGTPACAERMRALHSRGESDLERVEPVVRRILTDVRERGDASVRALTEEFDKRVIEHVRIPDDLWRSEAKKAPPAVVAALTAAADRIRAYHKHQVLADFAYEDAGVRLGQRVRPAASAGVYAPGGKARYPSSVLMTAVPASVAGVPRIVLASPRPTPEILAAAAIAGVTEVIDAGGAQAIAALAYGTESVARVDKIVGPGNIYVACAKRLVFGTVDIDQIAGPSEILVIADDGADPRVVAADLLSQAEHDEDAYALLITDSKRILDATLAEVRTQLSVLPRKAIAEASLTRNGSAFLVRNLDEAAALASDLAAEHLALLVREPRALFAKISHAGAVFLGDYTPEAAGDYVAGPSHVLPTGGAARHSSPLSVYDFLVRTSVIEYSQEAIRAQADLIESLAELEGLAAHANAVRVRR
jgi:histidinol dehydrogenase